MPLATGHRSPLGKSAALRGGWFVGFLIIVFTSRPASALDAERSITQALHRIWQNQQGLPEPTIYAVRQTHDGYLLIGTKTGVVRFDGVRFLPLASTSGDSINNIWIHDLVETSDATLWIATDHSGLYRLHDGGATHYSTRDGLASDTVYQVLLDRAGAVWACTSGGLCSAANEHFTRVEGVAQAILAVPRVACQTSDGTLYFAGDGDQLLVRRDNVFSSRRLAGLPQRTSVSAMLADPDGSLWVGTNVGLVHLREQQQTLLTTADGLADNWVCSLEPIHGGGVWVGTKDGFTRLRGDERESFRARDGLSQSTVCCMCEDRDGSLWVGTKHGLNQFLNRRVTPWTTSEGLASNDTGPLLQDQSGIVWVGTLGAGLSRYDGKRFATLTAADGLSSNTIYSIIEDAAHDLWIGTDHGLTQMRGGKVLRAFAKADGLPADLIRCMLIDPRGRLLVGTAAGVVCFDGHHFVPVEGLAATPVLVMQNWGEHELVAAVSGGGLYRCGDGHLTEFPYPNAIPDVITSLQAGSDATLWIGTMDRGLRLIQNGRLTAFSVADGLFDNEIFGVVLDAEDRLWMACSKGIFWIARGDLMKFAGGQLKHLTSMPFSPTEAMRTIECKPGVQPGNCRTHDGHIWFSTTHGVIVIDPTHLQRGQQPPPVAIERITVNGKAERAAAIGALPPGLNNIEFSYTGLSFLAPSRITFQYKLEGFDKDWTDAGSRRDAFYTNLPPGRYRFHVTARNADGLGDPAESVVSFSLSPHYYQRVWFLPACATFALLSAWLLYRMRVYRIKGRWNAILSERSRIARELHDTLIQGFSGVTMEMQALAGQLTASPQRATLHEIIRDAGLCLREARQSVAGLRSGAGLSSGTAAGLPAALTQTVRQMTETKDVQVQLNILPQTPALDDEVEYHLLRIAQEAVANALKHASPRQIEVSLEGARDSVLLSVTDDGCGFDLKRRVAPSGHYGLIGMQERAAQIGAALKLSSTPGRGTTVKIQIPLKKKIATTTSESRYAQEVAEDNHDQPNRTSSG